MKLEIIYEDDDIVAFNKPSGVLSIPHRFDASQVSLLKWAEQKMGKLFVVHRIDRETSGAIIFAKNENAHRHFSLQFQDRKVQKYYRALCVGHPVADQGVIQLGIMEHPTIKGKMVVNRKGKPAHSEYQVLKRWPGFAYLEVEIFTGRTHQIRVHLQSIGTPIVADDLYGNGQALKLSQFKKKFKLSEQVLEEPALMGRLALHAFRLVIKDTADKALEIVAPEPKDFRATIQQLDKWA